MEPPPEKKDFQEIPQVLEQILSRLERVLFKPKCHLAGPQGFEP
jgi:hypothetical protein